MRPARRGAIIGFGNVAANGHLPGWRARSDVRLVAVSDPDARRRALAVELLPEAHAYASAAELLAHEDLDFVDIAAPPAAHAPAIVAAAAAGVHILCEKPLTTSWSEYQSVRRAVQQAGVVLHTVHNWKYSEAFHVVSRLLAQGALGPLRAISFDTARNGCASASAENWRVRASVAGGGILVDHGWHAFYLMLTFAHERPFRIRAALERRRYLDAEVEDTALCDVDFPSIRAEIRLTWAAAARRTQWQLVGRDGRLTVDDDRVEVTGPRAQWSRPLTTALSAGSHHPDWFTGVIEEFHRALDDPAQRSGNLAEAELCLLLLDRAYASGALESQLLDIPASDVDGERSVEHA